MLAEGFEMKTIVKMTGLSEAVILQHNNEFSGE
jgi:hypothetical protein